MKLYEFLQSLPDRDVVEPVEAGALLNRVQREWGWSAAKLSDIVHERNRRTKLRQKDAQFQRDLIAIETAMGLGLRTLAGPYWDIRATHPLEASLPLLAEKAKVDLEHLTRECHRLRPPIKQGRPKGVPNSRPRVMKAKAPKPELKPKRPSARAGSPQEPKQPPAAPETVLAVRQMFLDGMSVSEIHKSQMAKRLPGTNKIIKNGNLLYMCTNLRQPTVGWPTIGLVIERFNGADAEKRAADTLRFRYQEIKRRFRT